MAQQKSYEKVFYDLRPAKQVERRIIIDTLQELSRSSFPIKKYQYTGFGSISFVDFIMFHKLLGINKLLRVEHSEDEKRIKFNKPFKQIDIKFGPISDYIASLNPESKHLLWLDYDFHLDNNVLEDVVSSAAQLSPGSIFIITVDIQITSKFANPAKRLKYYKREAGTFFKRTWKKKDLSPSKLPSVIFELLYSAIKNGLTGREGFDFYPLFKFIYADGHKMLTLGGVIGRDTELANLDRCDFSDLTFVRRNISELPYIIEVPILTRKEKMALDAAMPCTLNWRPKFELAETAITAYRDIYRFYPSYVEMLL